MKKEIKIVVAGECMSGKSSILYLLKQLLIEKGFDVERTPNMDYPTEKQFDYRIGKDIDKKLSSLKNKISIVLEEKQLNRSIVTKH